MEIVISIAGLLVVLVGAWLCRKERLFLALANALAALFAAAIALRYWWLLARLISSVVSFPAGELCFGCFWVPFGVTYYTLLRLKDGVDERDIPLYPPLVNRIFVPLLAAVPFCVFLCGIMASIQISLPQAWTTYDRTKMPIPWDRLLIDAYQDVEENICGISAHDPSHTRFPALKIPRIPTARPLWQ